MGKAAEARMEATTLVRLKPDWSQGYQRLGEALLALQEFEEAETVLEKGSKLAPSNKGMTNLLVQSRVQTARAMGNAAFQEQAFAEAASHYSLAIKLDPQDPEVHKLYSNRSACHYSLGDYKSALSDAENTIRHSPKWSKGYSRKGAALAGLGQNSAAFAAYKQALEMDPNNAATAAALAHLQGGGSQISAGSGAPSSDAARMQNRAVNGGRSDARNGAIDADRERQAPMSSRARGEGTLRRSNTISTSSVRRPSDAPAEQRAAPAVAPSQRRLQRCA